MGLVWYICDQSPRTEPVIGLSLSPARWNPVVVGFSYVLVDITAKFLRTISSGTSVELAFIDQKGRWIAVLQFAFGKVISAKASILWNIFGRVLAERDFIRHGSEIISRTPEPVLNCWVAFDGLVLSKVGNWVVSLQNCTVAVNVQPGFRNGLDALFG